MAVLRVPGSFSSIQSAVDAAAPGDRIVVASGYAGSESVAVTVNDLLFSAPASVTGIVLFAGAGITTISLGGDSPIQVVGTSGDDDVSGNAGANTYNTLGGTDTLRSGSGDDVFTINGGGGTAIGGRDNDTVRSNDLGTYSFFSTETLDSFGGGYVYGSLTQLRTFTTITNSLGAADSAITFYLTNAGGRVDFSSKVTGAHSIEVFSNTVTGAMDVVGTSNDDLLAGSAFDDRLDGGDGSDLIIGSGGTDILIGGAGGDTFRIEYGGAGFLSGGVGVDTVQSNDLGTFALYGVEILDTNGFNEIRASVAQLSAFDTITDDVAGASSRIAILLNGDGGILNLHERVTGSHSVYVVDAGLTGTVSVIGTENADVMVASGNITSLRGRGGNDSFQIDYAGSFGAGSVNGGGGIDTVLSNDLGSFSFSHVETLDTHGFNSVYARVAQLAAFDTITDSTADPDSQINLFLLGAGGTINLLDRMDASHSAYVVDAGLTGATAVTGTGFNDFMVASTNLNTLRGLDGNDTFQVDYGGSGSVDGGAGSDTVQSNDLGTFDVARVEILDLHGFGYVYATAAQLAAFDTITDGVAAADSQLTIFLRDGAGTVDLSSQITGAHSAALLAGALTAGLKATGSANGDALNGSNYGDTLLGGAGDDMLVGSGGADRLTGGSGADTFVFISQYDGVDIVTDFAAGTDRIEIAAGNFGGGLVAGGAVQLFIAASAAAFSAAGTDGRFIFDNQGTDAGTLYWDANGESGADSVAIAKFAGGATPSATDFLLI